ncbi:hypothetical protein C0J52_14533 [Blattella germanica]|nr:hypothetical protein C0J52_14533 [Blattella germanica]
MGGLGAEKMATHQIEESLRPPEGGWGWMVAFGMALMFISTTGQYLSFGPLFSGILEQLGEQTTGATVIMTALTASVNFTGLVTNHLLHMMSYRKVAVLGGVLFTSGILLTICARSMVHIVVTYSVLAGIGMGLMAPSSYLAINSYFVARRGVAMGLCQAGIGLGFIAIPYLVQAMLDNYGFRGTMLLLGGVALNSIVGALLYHPVEWHMVRLRLHKTLSKHQDEGMEEVSLNPTPVSMMGVTPLSMDVIPDEEDDLTMNNNNNHANGTVVALANDDSEYEEHVVISRRGSLVMSAMMDTRSHQALFPVQEEAIADASATARRSSLTLGNFGSNVLAFDNNIVENAAPNVFLTALHKVSKKFTDRNGDHRWSLLRQVPDEADEDNEEGVRKERPRRNSFLQSLDLGLLKDPVYVNIILGLSLSFASDTIFFIVFPFHLTQTPKLSLNDSQVTLCLSVTAGSDAVARLILPIIAAKLKIGPRAAYLIGCLSSAIVRSIFASVHEFTTVAAMSAVVGFLKGAMVVNLSLTIAEHCQLERFAAAYSLFMVINGVITLCLGPLIGVVRDLTGSFPVSIHVLSAIFMLCVLMWVTEYLWVSYKTQTLRSFTHTLKTRIC